MPTRHTASFTTVRGQRLPLLHIDKIPNQNNDTTDLLAALAAGNSFRLTERATLDLHDLLQNNIFDCESDLEEEKTEIADFDVDSSDACGVTVRTITDILQDLDALAAEPTAEELIAAYYSKPLLHPKAR
jgi:hypothetical protein